MMPEVIKRTPETEKAQEYSIPDLIAELAKKVVKDTKKGFKQDKKFDDAELIDLALSGVGGAIAIKGPKAASRALRTVIKKELKARGKPQDDWVSDVLRGSWFHGRGTYPKVGESFGASRQRQGNLGEPAGISLTAQPELFRHHFAEPSEKYSNVLSKLELLRGNVMEKLSVDMAKLSGLSREALENMPMPQYVQLVTTAPKIAKRHADYVALIDRIDESAKKMRASNKLQFARVLPKFNAPPEEVSLPVWKAARTMKAQEVMKDAYREALKKQPALFSGSSLEGQSIIANEIAQEAIGKFGVFNRETLAKVWRTFPDKAKKLMQFKVAHFELGLFLDAKGPMRSGSLGSLKGNWRSKIDAKKFNQDISDILTGKGYKSLLYSPHRYDEWEMRMLDPENVIKVDMRRLDDPGIRRLFNTRVRVNPFMMEKVPARRGKTLTKWQSRTEGFPYSLRDIYKDIDLEKIK